MAKITQNQIIDESFYGIEQAENIVNSSGGGTIATKNENDKVTITDTFFAEARINTNAGRDEIIVKKGVVNILDGADDDKITLGKDVEYAFINGGYGDDIVTTSAKLTQMYTDFGDDTLTASAGQTYIQVTTTTKDGKIFMSDGNRGDDLIKQGKGDVYLTFKDDFEYADLDKLIMMEQNNNDLVIKFIDQQGNYSSSITVQNHFKLGEKSSFKGFVFADETDASYFVTSANGGLTRKEIPQEVAPVYNEIFGTLSAEVIKGTKGNDSIQGMNGVDTIYAGAGNDIIDAQFGSVATLVYGEAGNDTIIAAGNDTINGGKGNNTIVLNYTSDDYTYFIADGGGTDTIVLQEGFTDISYHRDGNCLSIAAQDENSNKEIIVAINNYYGKNGKHSVKYLQTSKEIISLQDDINMPYNFISAEMDRKNNLKGTVYNDYMIASNFGDTIKGGKGSDEIHGGDGNDKLYGEDGHDYIDGGNGNDIIYGGKGSNSIETGLGNDTVYCDKDSSNWIYAGGGENKIYSSQGANTFGIENTESTTYLYKTTANDYLILEDVEDVENVRFNWDTAFKNKDLRITYNEGQTNVILVDYFKAKNGDFLNTISLNWNDEISFDDIYKELATPISMEELGKSKYTGTNFSDTITGREGNDTIYGGYGNDSIVCDTGNDKIYGEYGNDTIYAVQGNKYIDGGAGDDSITASKVGKHTLNGGTGNDTISYNAGANVTINGGDGNDSITASFVTSYDGKAKITAGAGNDYIKTLNGKLNDYIDAGTGNDTIIAFDGKDTLNGGKGNDSYTKIFENSEGTVITDTAGSYDVLRLQTNIKHDDNVGLEKGDATIFFDLKLDKKGNIVNNSSTDLFISTLDNIGDKKESITLKNYFKSGYEIEKIIIEGTQINYSITDADIDQLRSDIAGWLQDNGYTSTAQAFKDNDTAAMQEYLTIVDNAIGW